MKKILLLFFLFSGFALTAQKIDPDDLWTDVSYFYGSIARHSPDIVHLISGHPEGVIIGVHRKSFGAKPWEARYNYPDLGLSVIFQDLRNPYLGKNYSLYAHFNFYFLKRLLMLRVGQGMAVAANPYHPEENFYNNAYGSRLLSSSFLMANIFKENLFNGFGLQGGLAIIHYSNADFRSPNSSTNTLGLNLGINYTFDQEEPVYIPQEPRPKISWPVRWNLVVRSGMNTMGIIGAKARPFLTLSTYADQQLTPWSIIQAGAELFFSRAMEDRITYHAIVYPREGGIGEEDAKRVGIFLGHQLVLGELSLVTDLGYYLYYPFEHFVPRVYNRIGLRHEITNNFWGSVSLRSHGANAEAMEFSLGFRL